MVRARRGMRVKGWCEWKIKYILHKYSANLWNMNLIVWNRLYFCFNRIVWMWIQCRERKIVRNGMSKMWLDWKKVIWMKIKDILQKYSANLWDMNLLFLYRLVVSIYTLFEIIVESKKWEDQGIFALGLN